MIYISFFSHCIYCKTEVNLIFLFAKFIYVIYEIHNEKFIRFFFKIKNMIAEPVKFIKIKM